MSLPLEKPGIRSELFAKSAVALQEIDHKNRAKVTWLDPPALPSKRVEATLRHIAAHLFGNPRGTPRLRQADGLEIIEAAGPSGEARILAERIKRLLLEGVAPDQIVIAVRDADDETDMLRETLAAAGVPNAGTSRVPFLADARRPNASDRCSKRSWTIGPSTALCPLLRSNHFRPRWPSIAGDQGVKTAIRMLRKWKLCRRSPPHFAPAVVDCRGRKTPTDQS